MAIRRYYPATSHRPITTTFPERVQEDKWHFTHPQTTSRLKSTPHLYPYFWEDLKGNSFPETTSLDKWFSRWPDTTSRLKARPQYYPYTMFENIMGNNTKEAIHGDVINIVPRDIPPSSKKFHPVYQDFFGNDGFPRVPDVGEWGANENNPNTRRGSSPQYYQYLASSMVPIVPMPDMPTMDSQPRVVQGRIVNYMGNIVAQTIIAGRIHNLPLLGVG